MDFKEIFENAGIQMPLPSLIQEAMESLKAEKLKKQEIYINDIKNALEFFANGEETLESTQKEIALAMKNIEEIEQQYSANY